ncbi:MAG: SDR family oxidoreductase [Saprospiraceae bacterium]|nr:SDR family oxidoreductase [Saprospiraceae bacterium]
MKLVIIGASGLVGGNCMNYMNDRGWKTIGTYFSYQALNTCFYDTLNPSNPNNFDVIGFDPDVIIHCGALTHVDYCELNQAESWQKTVQSTMNVIKLAKEVDAKVVYISTDYVFDGLEGPYAEDEEPNPINVYGKHKLEAENLILDSKLDSLVVRVAKVFGDEERGKNFVARLAAQLKEGYLKWNGFTDQYTTAINAHDIARAIFHLLSDQKTGVYHLSYGEYFNAYELVMKVVSAFPQAEAHVGKITKADFKQEANRPPLGGLKNDKFASEYPDFEFTSIEKYLHQHLQS